MSEIDLSLLPSPQAVEEIDAEAIVEAMKQDFIAANPDMIEAVQYESDPVMMQFRTAAAREVIKRARINDGIRACMLAEAEGGDDQPEAEHQDVRTAPMEEFGADQGAGGGESPDIDVILDIPVTISMEVGNTQIPIRNLLQLNQGSVWPGVQPAFCERKAERGQAHGVGMVMEIVVDNDGHSPSPVSLVNLRDLLAHQEDVQRGRLGARGRQRNGTHRGDAVG